MKLPSVFSDVKPPMGMSFCLGGASETHRGGTGAFRIRGIGSGLAELSRVSVCKSLGFCISQPFVSSMVNLWFLRFIRDQHNQTSGCLFKFCYGSIVSEKQGILILCAFCWDDILRMFTWMHLAANAPEMGMLFLTHQYNILSFLAKLWES